jgi:hypothetical protein
MIISGGGSDKDLNRPNWLNPGSAYGRNGKHSACLIGLRTESILLALAQAWSVISADVVSKGGNDVNCALIKSPLGLQALVLRNWSRGVQYANTFRRS